MTTCSGEECPLKETCFRTLQKLKTGISSFIKIPYDIKKNKCNYYMELFKGSNQRIVSKEEIELYNNKYKK